MLTPQNARHVDIAVGDLDPARGVYLGTVEAAPGHVVHAYTAEDFLRDAKSQQLILNFNEAVQELNARNNGRSYGDGTDHTISQAIVNGTYCDGDLVLPSKELLHGRGVRGNATRPKENIRALLKAGKLPKIAAALATGEGDQLWAGSGSEHPLNTSGRYRVRLVDGDNVWSLKDSLMSAVLPVRFFRSASRVPTLTQGD